MEKADPDPTSISMPTLSGDLSSPGVYIKDTGTPKGRGVFASRSFKDGEIVEVCPVIILRGPFMELPEELKKIVFDWGVLANMPGTNALALGYGSMYNHNNPANMRYTASQAEHLLRFIAVRDIIPNEELTVNYNATGGGAEWGDDNWFVRMKVDPIVGP